MSKASRKTGNNWDSCVNFAWRRRQSMSDTSELTAHVWLCLRGPGCSSVGDAIGV